jgi:rhodanese-related sulfurtransferase
MNKKILMVSLMLIAVFSTSVIGAVLARPFYKVISIEKAHRMIFSKGHPDLVVIDIRPSGAYDFFGHIPGAINVPVIIPAGTPGVPGGFDQVIFDNWFEAEGKNLLNNKIIIYCMMGPGSMMYSPNFVEAGFKKVTIIDGAITAWIAAGYPIET